MISATSCGWPSSRSPHLHRVFFSPTSFAGENIPLCLTPSNHQSFQQISPPKIFLSKKKNSILSARSVTPGEKFSKPKFAIRRENTDAAGHNLNLKLDWHV